MNTTRSELLAEVAERALRRSMHPFMASELGKDFQLERNLTLGLVPGILGAADPAQALRAYAALYWREQVKAEGLVRNLASFGRFLEAMSFAQATPINLASTARECQVSRATVEGYLEVLEDLPLGWRLATFQRRAKRQLASHPRFFWFHTDGFRSVRPTEPPDRPEEIEGAALERLVAQHLRAWVDYSDADLTLHCWRTKTGNEVDFVVYGKSAFHAIEAKNQRQVRPADLKGLIAFGEDYPEARRSPAWLSQPTPGNQGSLPCSGKHAWAAAPSRASGDLCTVGSRSMPVRGTAPAMRTQEGRPLRFHEHRRRGLPRS